MKEQSLKERTKEESVSNDNEKLLAFVERQYGIAVEHKKKRVETVKRNLSVLKAIENVHREAETLNGKLIQNKNRGSFISPIPNMVVSQAATSGWVPQMTFEPEERKGQGDDRYLARNTQRIHSFLLDKGKFRKEARKAALDLFSTGRCFFLKGWDSKDSTIEGMVFQQATHLKYKHIKWEETFWTPDEHTWCNLRQYTRDELVSEFGEGVMSKDISPGNPFEAEKEAIKNWSEKNKESEKIGVLMLWNDVQKTFVVIIGSKKHLHIKFIGDLYPWTDPNGAGFIPINKVDAGMAMDSADHPLCDLDKIANIWASYVVLMNTMIERAKKQARSRHVLGSDQDPKQARQQWLQSEADWRAGLDIPHFVKSAGVGNSMFASSLEHGQNIADPLALRDMMYDEMSIATGRNIRGITQQADTLGQEQLRIQRELEADQEHLVANEENWRDFARVDIYMLKLADSEFLDEHIALEDEVTEDSDTQGETYQGSVREIIDQLQDFEFNVRLSVNNDNSKRKSVDQFQKQEALNSLAPHFQGSPAMAKMAVEFAAGTFPNLSEEDFIQAQPQAAEQSIPGQPQAPSPNPAQQAQSPQGFEAQALQNQIGGATPKV